ncbi:hypothetical protein OIU74_007878 [Salix koriyanagi]|uniref:Uncharacterized protein n=1 Tax=Salix koriyanagi TaxID=2511006 RepID=A0A9Q0U4U4_9ROSI|nr:hypothetical protein OIU74_007878 [Salix koriyanagi]
MEKIECPSKQRKNKARITINIGGLVVLGGVFVVTGLIAAAAAAAFAVKKRRRRRDTGMEGLPCKNEVKGSTLQQNPCLTDGSTGMDTAAAIQIDSVELVSTESLILEENSASMINVENDNFTGDDQETLLILDSESMNEVEDSIKNDSEDNSSCLVRIEIIRQEEEEDTAKDYGRRN